MRSPTYIATVSAAAANIGGKRLNTNRRPATPWRGKLTWWALRAMLQAPIPAAIAAATIQVKSHASGEAQSLARVAAARPVRPIPTPPHPGTPVNEVARSIVVRMNRRSAAAFCSIGAGSDGATRCRKGVDIKPKVPSTPCLSQELCHVKLWLSNMASMASTEVAGCRQTCFLGSCFFGFHSRHRVKWNCLTWN